MTNEDLRETGQSADDRPEGNAPIQELPPSPPEGKADAKPEDRTGWIPPKAHTVEKNRRRQAEQEAAQLRGYLSALQEQVRTVQQPQQQAPSQPQAMPDWYTDPEAAWKARYQHSVEPEIGSIRKQMEDFQGRLSQTPKQVLFETSRMVANNVHGEDAVRTAYEALDTAMKADPRLDAEIKARLQVSTDPFGEIVRWHKNQAEKANQPDMDAEVERRVAERLAHMNGTAPPPMSSYAPQSPYPSNFANARNSGSKQNGAAFSGPKPLREIFGGR
jgi:hypothetical protein